MFIGKQLHGAELAEHHGYWKKLYKDPNNNYATLNQLTAMHQLCIHSKIAPMLLDYTLLDEFVQTKKIKKHPFQDTIRIWIWDDKTQDYVKFEMIYWNGASPTQTHSFKIRKVNSGRTNYYQWCDGGLRNYNWYWYDNDNSRFKKYMYSSEVNFQLEISFKANLWFNYPPDIHCYETGKYRSNEFWFNWCGLNILKKEWTIERKEKGRFESTDDDKVMAFRATFDKDNNEITMVEQMSVTNYAFPRTIQRRSLTLPPSNKVEEMWGVETYDDQLFNLRCF